jgi:hypothetical protein
LRVFFCDFVMSGSEWSYLPDDKLRQLVMKHVSEQSSRYDEDKARVAAQNLDLRNFQAAHPQTAPEPALAASLTRAERIAQQASFESERALFQVKSLTSALENAVEHIKNLEQRLNVCEDENRSLTLQLDALRTHVLRQDRKEAPTSAGASAESYPAITAVPVPVLPPALPTTVAAAGAVSVTTAATSSGSPLGQRKMEAGDSSEARNVVSMTSPGLAAAAAVAVARKETVCDQCFSRAMCVACRNCQSEWYCTVNCQVLRQETHRLACGMLREKRLKRLAASGAAPGAGTGDL